MRSMFDKMKKGTSFGHLAEDLKEHFSHIYHLEAINYEAQNSSTCVLICKRKSTMASEEGDVVAVMELQQEQPRGREEQARTQSKRGKSKAPAGESLERRVVSLESLMDGVRASVGELSDQIEKLILENGEITRIAKVMIEELGCTFRGELRSLTQDLSDLRKFVERELHNRHAEMDEIHHEWQSYHRTISLASTSTATIAMHGLKVPNQPFVKSLVDYSSKNKKPNLGKSGLKKGHDLKDSENKKSFNGSTKQEKAFPPKKDTSKLPKPYFICEGPHWTRDCPNWKAINALVTEMREKEAKESQADIGSLQHLGALSKIFSLINVEEKGLLYVDLAIEGKTTSAMIDIRATHNFIDVQEAKRLDIKYKQGSGTIKAVNSEAKPIMGIAEAVKVKIGDWQGMLYFTVIPMDDFKVVLRLAFFCKNYTFPIPAVNSLVILDAKIIRVIPLRRMEKDKPMISVMQFKKGLRKDE
ncbi:hypothetical protein L6164_002751 [Bauhinia variegata]|uniref:Uncharacterized protein n=1 Tax=Bauhinia variegata TaxID=167791 RepID=A0ACB9PZ55_BAUVA|nr:hypothetical protein L6164_002751 [Bauhinia variegata]